MMIALVIRVFSTLCFVATASRAVLLTKPGCQDRCGDVSILYPFGIGAECSANSSFTVICQNSTTPPRPLLMSGSITMEVVNISLYGTVMVNLPVSPMNCSYWSRTESVPISLQGGPFSISARYNSLVVMGCKNSVWLRPNATTVAGCMSVCDANSSDTACNGVNCCQTSIPTRLQELRYTYLSIGADNSSSCGYVFPADKSWLQKKGYEKYEGLMTDPSNPFDRDFRFAPLVLEWELGKESNLSSHSFCNYPNDLRATYAYRYCYDASSGDTIPGDRYPDLFCGKNPMDDRCQSLLESYENEYRDVFYYSVYDYLSSSRYCSCMSGYEGNPYVLKGCSDVDECRNPRLNPCSSYTTCINTEGSFICEFEYNPNNYSYGYGEEYGKDSHHYNRFRTIIVIASIVIGTVVGVVMLLALAWKFGNAIGETIKAIKASRKFMFFKRNGGILLEQQLTTIKNGIEKTKLFTSEELAKATDKYNENRILGRGGEGVVYKGMLEDGRIVAVKKSERVNQRVNQGDVEAFINEVVIGSQIDHRNVVKLLGCCLESEVPRLVYEFIPNSTLFSHIHHPHEDFPLIWEMRVRIAKQVAGALAYLHSYASVPIYHRDIKSTNILLDEKYHAKISDFGTLRSISIDQTHATTRVVGTFGYLDPEYFQSNQFTEKSDVYSFGVVLVELLTGEKAVSAVRVEEGRGLAMHFLHSMEEGRLFDILDPRVLREGKREDIEAMAGIARKCLHLNGKGRPTMKEVACHLEGIQVEDSNGCIFVEDFGSDGLSTISEITESPSSDEFYV